MNGPDFQYDGLTAFAPITNLATSAKKGLLSAADKAKLDSLDATKVALLADPPRVRAYRATALSTAHAALTPIPFEGARYNTPGAYGGTAPWGLGNPTVLSAWKAGLYSMGGYVAWANGPGFVRMLWLRVNGALVIAQDEKAVTGAGNLVAATIGADFWLNAGEYVQIIAYQDSGAALNVNAAEGWLRYVCD